MAGSRTSSRLPLVEDVAGRIRDLIVTNQLVSGDRLPSEAELLAEHGVSRSVLREAINRLSQIGLVEVRHGRGMFVGDQDAIASFLNFASSTLSITTRDLTQFGELRGALECWAARRAAQLATPEHLAHLDELVEQLDQSHCDYEESIKLDFEFHRYLFEIAAIPLVTSVIDVLQQFVLEGMLQTTPEPRDREVSQQLHRTIVAAVREHDQDRAEKAMREHMRVTVDRLEAHATTVLSDTPTTP